MAIKISDMEPYGKSISDNDMFEMVAQNELKSYRVSAQNIADYCKLVNNGAFKGVTTKNLNDFTYADVGVWLWTGDSPFAYPEITQAYVEIICYYKPGDQTVTNLVYIQRMSAGTFVYQRIFSSGKWGNWASLTNRNGNRIEYGHVEDVDTIATIKFDPPFKSAPAFTVSTIADTKDYIYFAQVTAVDADHATVKVFQSATAKVITTESSTTTESGSTKKTETSYSIDQGGWEAGKGVTLHWIATLEEG